MPLYEYYCSDCHQTFESLRPMSQADAPLPCKVCAGDHTSRTLSLFAAHTKGQNGGSRRPVGNTGGGCCGGGLCGCSH